MNVVITQRVIGFKLCLKLVQNPPGDLFSFNILSPENSTPGKWLYFCSLIG